MKMSITSSCMCIVLDHLWTFKEQVLGLIAFVPKYYFWNQLHVFLNTHSPQGTALGNLGDVTPTFRASGTPFSGFYCWLTVCTFSSPLLASSHLSDFWIWSSSGPVLRTCFCLTPKRAFIAHGFTYHLTLIKLCPRSWTYIWLPVGCLLGISELSRTELLISSETCCFCSSIILVNRNYSTSFHGRNLTVILNPSFSLRPPKLPTNLVGSSSQLNILRNQPPLTTLCLPPYSKPLLISCYNYYSGLPTSLCFSLLSYSVFSPPSSQNDLSKIGISSPSCHHGFSYHSE